MSRWAGKPTRMPLNQTTVNRTLTDCNTNVIVRNSGYANFAGDPLPSGNGSFISV